MRGETTAAETLRTVAEMMRTQHGEGCPERGFWETLANWLETVALEERAGQGNVRERISAVRIAEAYLVGQEATA